MAQGMDHVKQAINHYDAVKNAVQQCDIQAILHHAEQLGEKLQQARWTAEEIGGADGTLIRNEANVIDTFFTDFSHTIGDVCKPKFSRGAVEESLRDVQLEGARDRVGYIIKAPSVLVKEADLDVDYNDFGDFATGY
ncbi:hypothetical protein LCGC14_0621410 [marine sediment metagenome]|uniref:Uncharacterized protein n=1 Tax=marine sediment metagenome TaxID=412755 RepID=A0A0F9R9T5_9ZZZZ